MKIHIFALITILLSTSVSAWEHERVKVSNPRDRDYHRWTSVEQEDTGASALLECSVRTGTEFSYTPHGIRYQVPVEKGMRTFTKIIIGTVLFKPEDLDFWGSKTNRRNIERLVEALNKYETIVLFTDDDKSFVITDLNPGGIDSDLCSIGFPSNIDSQTRAAIK